MVAGGYSNEFESTVTADFYPWIARFKTKKSSTDPVMDQGFLVKGLPNYQAVSASFAKGYYNA